MADWDEVEGKTKEGAGKLSGDESLEREGQVQGKVGEAKDEAGDAWDEAKDKMEDAKDRL